MSGFTDFLKNSAGSLIGLLPAALSSNYRKKLFGTGLTAAEKEANEFESQQAERQMAFQQQMSNTQYQRGVIDMQNAGLNPALMYGNGASGASSPAGAMAASESPSQLDPVGLIGQIANLQLLHAQRKNIEADTEGKKQNIEESKERIKSIRQSVAESLKSIEVMDSNIRKMGLESESLSIANRFLATEKEMALMVSGLTASEIDARISEIDGKIKLLSAQEREVLQNISESRARIKTLLSQASLNAAQEKEVVALEEKIKKEAEKIVKETSLTQKDIDFYGWNHTLVTRTQSPILSMDDVHKPRKDYEK